MSSTYYSEINNLDVLIFILLVTVTFFLPVVVAVITKHHNMLAIFLLNLFLGWTVIGWIAALVWAATKPGTSTHRHHHH